MKHNKVTIKDIAKECSVSITTVSRVLNNVEGCCRPEIERAIRDAIIKLNYLPNPIARSLVTKKTNMLAVLIPDIYNIFFQEFYKGVEEYANDHGYKILLCNTDGQQKENAFINELSHYIVDGIIITTLNTWENNDCILRLAKEEFPFVTVERYGDELLNTCRIFYNNEKAAEMAVHKLYENGHRKIVFIAGPEGTINGKLRLSGYRRALHNLGLDFDEGLVCNGDYKMMSGYETIKELLMREKFTSIVAANDLMAIGACKAVREAGMSVPDHISVVGFDGTLLSKFHQPPLTTLVVYGYEMGRGAAENLLKIINMKRIFQARVVFEPEIREGGSIRCVL